jgi:hypothetical protein
MRAPARGIAGSPAECPGRGAPACSSGPQHAFVGARGLLLGLAPLRGLALASAALKWRGRWCSAGAGTAPRSLEVRSHKGRDVTGPEALAGRPVLRRAGPWGPEGLRSAGNRKGRLRVIGCGIACLRQRGKSASCPLGCRSPARLAQLDRALASGAKGHRFESCIARTRARNRWIFQAVPGPSLFRRALQEGRLSGGGG